MRLTDFEPVRVDELAPATLASYKTKAGAAATAADAAGDVKTADKRFSGIVKATKKQFDQDAKGVSEGLDDTVRFEVDSENAYNHIMDQFGSVIDWDGDTMVAPRKYWGAIQELALAASGEASEEHGLAENYPKHQDLSGISTDKLKAYLDKQSKQQVSGEGNQVQRVRAELERRSQGVAEGPNDGLEDNFTIEDIKRLEKIRDLETLKAQAKELIKGKPARRMNPEKISWFYNHIDTLRNPLAVIKMMYDLLLAGEGNRVLGSRNSMSSNSYRQRFGEQSVAEDTLAGMKRLAGIAPVQTPTTPGQRQYRHMPTAVQPR